MTEAFEHNCTESRVYSLEIIYWVLGLVTVVHKTKINLQNLDPSFKDLKISVKLLFLIDFVALFVDPIYVGFKPSLFF